ncbi:MAG: hypothetical protein ACO39Y_09015, partial [Ilumatobacteraceae bacterium]
DCARYFAPSAMKSDGSCPSCGRTLEGPAVAPTGHRRVTSENMDLRALAARSGEDPRAPWHFKLLVTGVTLYGGWRLLDLFV